MSLNSIESAAQETRDGLTYWVYEHLSQVTDTLTLRVHVQLPQDQE